jgi:MFS family permease
LFHQLIMAAMIRNIAALYLIKISKWFNLVMPVVVLFYQDNGMGMHEIFVLKSIYSVAIVSMELPSGWMADVWGRKRTLILGSMLGSAGFLIYSFAYGFWAFVLAEMVLGIGHSFVSGADSAMLYESLKADKKADKYVKHEGRITSAGNFAEAIAGIAAGFLAAISLRTPFYVQFAVATLALPAAFALVEPKIRIATHIRSVRRMIWNINTALRGSPGLRISILLSAVTGTATLTFAWLVQPFFKAIGLPVEFFGIFWTILNLSTGVSSALAYKAEGVFGKRKNVLFIIGALAAGYFLSGMFVVREGVVFLLLFYVVRGIATPVFKNYINLYTPSEMRATILSVRNLIIRIIFAVIGPLLGWLTDHLSLNSAFILAGAIYLTAALTIVWPWIKQREEHL